MKTIIAIVLFFLSVNTFAQGAYTNEQRRRDSLRLDSVGGAWLLTGPHRILAKLVPKNIQPSTKICFDKRFQFYSNYKGKIRRGCFYINTTDGYVAQFFGPTNVECPDMANPQPGFDIAIINKLGESIRYSIDKKGKKRYLLLPSATAPNTSDRGKLVKQNPNYIGPPTEYYTDNQLPAVAYVLQGISASSRRYLFGNTFPESIQIKNYLGVFGLGYFESDTKRSYISLAIESPGNYVKVEKIEDVNECFDGSSFNKDSREENTEIFEEIKKNKENEIALKEKNLAGNSGQCAETDKAIIAHEKLMLEKEKKASEYFASKKSTTTLEGQRTMAAAGDAKDRVIALRLKRERKLCDIDYSLYINKKMQNTTKIVAKLNAQRICTVQAIEELKEIIDAMTAIDNRYVNQPAKAVQEKNMMYFKKLSAVQNCN